MATRVKESGAKGKEKKGVPQQKRSTNTSKLTSSAPNYLKPTASSVVIGGVHEAKKIQGDKPSMVVRRKSLDKPATATATSSHLGDSNNKPYLARRKSFDRPPPTQGNNKPTTLVRTKLGDNKKTQPSSTRNGGVSNARGKMVRSSSSLVAKSSPSSTALHPLKPRKQLDTLSPSRPAKKSQEKGRESSLVTEPNPNHTVEVSTNKTVQEMENIILADEELEDLKSFEHCSLLVPEDPIDHSDTIEEGDDNEDSSGEITEVADFQESAHIVLMAEDPHIEDGDDENKSTTTTETIIIDPKFEEIGNDSDNYTNDDIEERQEEEEEKASKDNKGDHHHDDQELAAEEDVKESIENNNSVTDDVPAATAHHVSEVIQGTKNESVVSNDVIEETASKLREQRKNKVKALAGAFETVISLQEPK